MVHYLWYESYQIEPNLKYCSTRRGSKVAQRGQGTSPGIEPVVTSARIAAMPVATDPRSPRRLKKPKIRCSSTMTCHNMATAPAIEVVVIGSDHSSHNTSATGLRSQSETPEEA